MNKEPLGNYRSLSASVMIIKVMCYHVPLFRFFIFDFNFLKLYQKFLNSYKKFFWESLTK